VVREIETVSETERSIELRCEACDRREAEETTAEIQKAEA
jgi:hypothetical protein